MGNSVILDCLHAAVLLNNKHTNINNNNLGFCHVSYCVICCRLQYVL